MEKSSNKLNILLISLLILLILGILFIFFFIPSLVQGQSAGSSFNALGRFVCLNEGGNMENGECDFGFQTLDGKKYAFVFSKKEKAPKLEVGSWMFLSGRVSKGNISGFITIESSKVYN